jgi:hypothetical protein
MTLGHFQKKLTTQFGRNVANIEVLTTNNDVERASLDPHKVMLFDTRHIELSNARCRRRVRAWRSQSYLQIGSVKPYSENVSTVAGYVSSDATKKNR